MLSRKGTVSELLKGESICSEFDVRLDSGERHVTREGGLVIAAWGDLNLMYFPGNVRHYTTKDGKRGLRFYVEIAGELA